ncbi:hypothetical protein M413DRAFT_317271 [Hebeloma cylindrosporum]|uniref:GATA-type domain-containing protein n=1 Tax=Hebeloma cylindrosporum TaxID=76867 RepID=A0A0C2Y9M1_HEBCY|nr:hypothetical protein M413DRAFT_317271 [Hebeloma cylindrosporum h7]
MDSTLSFDGYTSYSDASTPRTPSPTEMHFPHDHQHFKQDIQAGNNNPYSFNGVNGSGPNNGSRGSLLQELYEPEIAEPPEPSFQQHADNWNGQRPSEISMMRRATFPYVRHDRDDGMPMQQHSPFLQQHQQQMLSHQDNLMHYSSSRHDNGGLYGDHHNSEQFIPSMSSSPHSSYRDFEDPTSIKLEDGAPLMVPSQNSPAFYHHHSHHRPSSSPMPNPSSLGGPGGNGLPMSMPYLSPHTGLPVQHTDDAASKETQYLRRRYFNCHTTEPPSWRRSTLNPGKIVCNKCGLYERTHLRPRPLRFDELRAGNKARKHSKGTVAAAAGGGGGLSPKQGKGIKKEPREYGAGALLRRSSVSSTSSVHSGSGASDWDDNVSIYSSGSAPPTSFNSPIQHPFPLSRDNSQSPPRDNSGIRLPNNPLSDIASMHMSQSPPHLSQQSQSQHPTPRKSHTSPAYYSPAQSGLSLSQSGSPSLSSSGQGESGNGSAASSVHASPAMSHALLGQEFENGVGSEQVSVGSS